MRYISRLLILCLLLCGCSRPETAKPLAVPTETVAAQGLYDTGSDLEISSSGAVKIYPLGDRTGKGLLRIDDNLLLFSEGENTTLTLLTGDTLVPGASKQLSFSLDPEACTVFQEKLSYFDPRLQKTILLGENLEILKQIDSPKELSGYPLFSIADDLLYYCTEDTIRVWDLTTNIHRVLRDIRTSPLQICGLYGSGSVLRCKDAQGISRFYATDTGALLYEDDAPMKLAAGNNTYAAAVWETNLWSPVFSLDGKHQQALIPKSLSSEYFLFTSPAVIVTAAPSGKVITLDRYDLSSGHCSATWMFQGQVPRSIVAQDDMLWGLAYLDACEGYGIFRWDPNGTPSRDSRIYTGPHYTAVNPDLKGLSLCRETAETIGQRYGLEILVWEDAVNAASKSSIPQAEHRVNILNRELELLDHRLSRFPQGMLETTAGNFPALSICLVAKADADPCISQTAIVLCAGSTSEAGLYHGLFHVMETHILSHSSALDSWSELNPQGFRYDYDYNFNAIRNSGIYLTAENRSFVDTFSMSFPKEDRARIFEYAMLPNQSHLFETQTMQKKLAAVCLGIRESYGLDDDAAFPWEQYLK